MTSAFWDSTLLSLCWRVSFDSLVAAVIVFWWSRYLQIPSGTGRRQLLVVVMVLPLVTGVIASPGILGIRHESAWLDTSRILALPIYRGMLVHHLVVALFLFTTVVTFWQELWPAFRHRQPVGTDPPEALGRWSRALPGWSRCRVVVTTRGDIFAVTSGRPSRPRLHLSRGAIERLRAAELEAVVRHEHAHWRRGRWLSSHLLFLVRLLQIFNPLALWLFREYTVENEVACDLDATVLGGRRTLAAALLKVYRSTDPRDLPERARLRKRVDVLRGRIPVSEEPLPVATLGVAIGILTLVLPWLV